jgi:hypothetical protein
MSLWPPCILKRIEPFSLKGAEIVSKILLVRLKHCAAIALNNRLVSFSPQAQSHAAAF